MDIDRLLIRKRTLIYITYISHFTKHISSLSLSSYIIVSLLVISLCTFIKLNEPVTLTEAAPMWHHSCHRSAACRWKWCYPVTEGEGAGHALLSWGGSRFRAACVFLVEHAGYKTASCHQTEKESDRQRDREIESIREKETGQGRGKWKKGIIEGGKAEWYCGVREENRDIEWKKRRETLS